MRFILIILVSIGIFSCKKEPEKFKEPIQIAGSAFGTTFHITYYDTLQRDFTKQIDSLFYLVNKSMSTYLPTSDISKINQGDTSIVVDAYFAEVFKKSRKIYEETNGIFDPTIGVLVNAWGFGPASSSEKPDSLMVKQLLKNLVGFDNVQLKNNKIVKTNDSIYFDFNAIAKGYAGDVVGRYFEAKQLDNYLIEIGGEIRARGIHEKKNTPWRVGIENPNFDGSRSYRKIIFLKDKAMATSGSYRKFKIDSVTGKKYAHIINAKTGFPSKTNLLSVSVISTLDLADVDGYATAFMAMSLEEVKEFLKQRQELDVFIIYSDVEGNLKTFTDFNNEAVN
jgi:thiamine biosynthesis lipoprotein